MSDEHTSASGIIHTDRADARQHPVDEHDRRMALNQLSQFLLWQLELQITTPSTLRCSECEASPPRARVFDGVAQQYAIARFVAASSAPG